MTVEDFHPTYFQSQRVPEGARLVGYAALVHQLKIHSPLRHNPSCVSDQFYRESKPKQNGMFLVYGKRYWPGDRLQDHLEFSLRHETFDLLCLSRIFKNIPIEEIESSVAEKPNGIYARRIWFLYEYLLQKKIKVEDLTAVTIQPLLDPQKYYVNKTGPISKRHRIQNNMLGNRDFCPVIQKTEKIAKAIEQKFDEQAKQIMAKVSRTTIMRAASFLLLADTQASFAIEGERAPRLRLERWLKAVSNAGKNRFDLQELNRLHGILIHDNRFTPVGVRQEEVFLGERDVYGSPLPEFIGAKQSDLVTLLEGFFQVSSTLEGSDVDAVLRAAALAFGFVYIHPLADGNGRMHRYILHHILSRSGYTPTGVIFPISSVLLERIDDYRSILTAHTGPLMDYIEWEPNDKGNVRILNDTADLYKYFDCTKAAEFVYECLEHMIKHSIPAELTYLESYDRVLNGIEMIVEMPNEKVKRLIHYIRENHGKLGNNRRSGEFAALTNAELEKIEELVNHHLPAR